MSTDERGRLALVMWKFALPSDRAVLQLPAGAQILSAGEQDSAVVVWAMCDPAAPLVDSVVAAINTGNPVPASTPRFVGTVIVGHIVWHVFTDHPERETE